LFVLIDQLKKDLNKVKGEIRLKTAALEQRLAEIQATPQTLARQTGASAAARRVIQADIMFLQAKAQFLMDDIKLGLELAQSAVDAKYNPILEKIDIKQQQLDLIKDVADEDTNRYITALNLALKQQADQVAAQKAVETSINGVVADYLNAANKAGVTIDTNIIDKIKSAKTEIDALQILAENAPGNLLSVAEAKSLGVPYGTTREEAMNRNIIPTTPSRRTTSLDTGDDTGDPDGFKPTNSQKQKLQEVGLQDADQLIQNSYIQLGPTDQKEFKADFAKASQIMSTTPELFFVQWLSARYLAEASGEANDLNDFDNL